MLPDKQIRERKIEIKILKTLQRDCTLDLAKHFFYIFRIEGLSNGNWRFLWVLLIVIYLISSFVGKNGNSMIQDDHWNEYNQSEPW